MAAAIPSVLCFAIYGKKIKTMLDILQEIFATMRRNKLRTSLTGFSVAWGIFMLIFLLGAGNGLIRGLTNNTKRFLANSMEVFGGQTSKAWHGMEEGRRITLKDGDMATSTNKFPDIVDTIGAEIEQTAIVATDGGNYINATLNGVYPNLASINKINMVAGRFVNDIDIKQRRKVIVVSHNQAKELKPDNYAGLVGRHVKVGNLSFEVVGITETDQSGMGNDTYAPYTTVRDIYGRGDNVDRIAFSFHGLKTMKDNQDFETQYRASLNTNHDAAPDDEDAVWLWNRLTQNMEMDTAMSIVHTALWVVGLLTLVSGIVGIGNIMLISVRERTREFGIRKAIGAKPSSILKLVITESVIITTFFGYIGMLIGIAANQYMDATIGHQAINVGAGMKVTTFLNPTVGLETCVAATVVMIIAGTIAGLIPAWKAAKVKPIEALNAE